MNYYRIYFSNPANQYVQVEVIFTELKEKYIEIKLPRWRPGRYELGNFAKNIKGFTVIDAETLQPLSFEKTDSHTWEVSTSDTKSIKVLYQYYANELNAGSTFLNHQQLYVNPVNCCVYFEEMINSECELQIDVPKDYKIAIGLDTLSQQKYKADNFHELADSPFIASPHLKTFSVVVRDCTFYFDFMGECLVDEQKLKKDFIPFIERQLDFFGDIPTKIYRFLFQILPIRFYHGVEHRTTTVIALGPGYNLYNGNTYLDLLGVSCHELFHVWNIKSIRPAEMLPYDYSGENYAKTGFVYEGITTYYGDLLLLQSKVYSESDYFDTLEERLQKHFHNDGRFNLSVAESSFDTWLDGYVSGAPSRKTSIYDEGNLIAFILDVFIMKNSNNEYNLENVMKDLYQNYHKENLGYEFQDIIALVNKYASVSSEYLFEALVTGKDNYLPYLNESFDYLGLKLNVEPSQNLYERYFGFKLVEVNGDQKITSIAEDSPAALAGLSIGDILLNINSISIQNDGHHWLNYFIAKGGKIHLSVKNGGLIKGICLSMDALNRQAFFFNKYRISHVSNVQSINYKIWSNSNN
jgi:predicted metalloprotease with PDZ domain